MKKIKEDKIIETYYTETFSSGIVKCILNTYRKWIEYDSINYWTYYDEFKCLQFTKHGQDKFIIENFDLTLDDKMKYVKLVNQEKGQIIIYFIPYNLIEKEKWLKD